MLRSQGRFPGTGAAPTLVLIYLTVLIALGACGGEQTPTSTATNVPAGPTATTVPSPTPEPTTLAPPGATQAPTDTPSPELTRIPIATLTQIPAFGSDEGTQHHCDIIPGSDPCTDTCTKSYADVHSAAHIDTGADLSSYGGKATGHINPQSDADCHAKSNA